MAEEQTATDTSEEVLGEVSEEAIDEAVDEEPSEGGGAANNGPPSPDACPPCKSGAPPG